MNQQQELQSVPASRRAIWTIAAATGIGSLSINIWYPFLPLFMLQVGARDEADALFWVAVGMTAQGVMRLLGGPLWGLLADRVGHKRMFVRALFGVCITSLALSLIHAPWQVGIALGLQGFLSGFIPAAVSLTTVIVPDARVKSSLSIISGTQYLGSAIGPAIGAALAIAFGYRGAVLSCVVLMAMVATSVIFLVPADRRHRPGRAAADPVPRIEPFKPTLQFALAILLYFSIFALNGFRSVATPIALKQIADADVTAQLGLTFALGGVASALGVWLLAGGIFAKRRLRTSLVVTTALTAAAHLLLAVSDTVWLYIVAFTVASLLNASLMPATNALIAFNVSRARRGTAFGLASAAQALAFMAGPMAAALFASISLAAGFATAGIMLIGLAALIGFAVREPPMEEIGPDEMPRGRGDD